MSEKRLRETDLVASGPSPPDEFDEFCSQIRDTIYDTEKRLRVLIVDRCQQEWGNGWQDRLCERHADDAKIWLERQARYKPMLETYKLPLGTLLDHSTLGQLRNVILAEWQLFRDVFQLKKASGKENKKALNEYLEWVIETRNALSHSLPVHPHQLRRAWWVCDEIKMQIAKWRGESLWRRAAVEEERAPKRTAISHFTTLKRYLTRRGPHFPKASDFEEGLVYLPEEYVSFVRRTLRETKRSLLVGRSAAGKTVLAIALGRHLEETEGYEVYYGDAARAQEGDGRAWYQEMRINDHAGVLYVLDNCHLAPEEANEFCFQWEMAPPKQAQAILISRPRDGESEMPSTEIGDYFDICADIVIEVGPEDIYHGVIEQHATAYRRRDPDFYVALEDDNEALLRAQHSHNLVASRSRMKAWREMGGRLSEVTPEAVYRALAQKYLSQAPEALAALCALWQYEIPAHNVFVAELPDDDSI